MMAQKEVEHPITADKDDAYWERSLNKQNMMAQASDDCTHGDDIHKITQPHDKNLKCAQASDDCTHGDDIHKITQPHDKNLKCAQASDDCTHGDDIHKLTQPHDKNLKCAQIEAYDHPISTAKDDAYFENSLNKQGIKLMQKEGEHPITKDKDDTYWENSLNKNSMLA